MASKNALLILGLLAMVVIISAREFSESSFNYKADDQKEGGGCPSGTDCFGGWGWGLPGGGWKGGMPGGGMPGGGMPGGGMPGGGYGGYPPSRHV